MTAHTTAKVRCLPGNRGIAAALLVLLGGLSLSSAGSADTYPKNFDIDVRHYRFELALSDERDSIEGTTTIDVRFLAAAVTDFAIDFVGRAEADAETGMIVEGVQELGADRAEHTHENGRLRIELSSPSQSGEIRRFQIDYHGTPGTGLQIGDNMHGDRTFFSDNWPNRARHWLPTLDHPYDKATSEMIVTAPNHYQVISNGLLIEETDLEEADNGVHLRRTHWKQSVPIATWLYVLGAARFAVDYFDDLDGISLQTWVYAQDRDAGFYDFAAPTKDVMEFYADLIGPYAYEKLANVQSNSVGGGMEAATAIFYGDNSVTGERSVRWRNVIIHEIAHQWWGNAVTENDWDHVWLSEGFATYFTLVYRDYAYGRGDFLEGLAGAKQRVADFYADNPDYRIVHENLDDMSRVTTGMTYQKGAWFLHMLRGLIGEDEFWEGIREYYRLYRNGNASTDDLREVMERAAGPDTDLTEFFQQWLYQGGFLDVRGTWDWHADTNELVVELQQLDDDGYFFEMPIPLEIRFASGGGRRGGPRNWTGHISLLRTSTRFEVELEQEPSEVLLDPDSWILMEANFRRRERN